MAKNTTQSSSATARKVRRTAKRTAKKLGTGTLIALVIALIVGIAAGAALAYYKTKDDGFTLADSDTALVAGQSYRYEDLLSEYTAVSLGRDVSGKVTATPGFEVGADGTVALEEGSYYITYSMPAFLGKSVTRIQTVTVVSPESAEGGAENG